MSDRPISVLHAVTDPISTILMRGQLAYLQTNGFEPALLTGFGRQSQDQESGGGYPVHRVAMTREIAPGADLRSLFDLWRLLRRIRPVICNAGTPKAGLLVGLAAWLTRVPCHVYTLRGLRLETATGIKRSLLMLTEKTACFTAHRVICVSSSLRERAIALGLVARSKTVLLGAGSSNGVDSGRFERTPEKAVLATALREELGIRPGQPVIGFAGRLTRDKGLPELVTAFQTVQEKMPEAVLLLVGDYEQGDPVPEETRNAIASEAGIRHVGFTSQIDLHYLVMDIFVLPTHREGFPNTVLEAQAAGLPVVTTDATGAVDAIEDGITGVLTPVGDADKLAETLLSLLSDPSRMQSMGSSGRERILREFRNERIWQELTLFYRAMLQERGYPLPTGSSVEAVRCAQTQ
ncbi:glycosyltransferase family 4 protein [Granulicella mallensis]|uniref:Glycosyl transferase group 1 n=1 Tax=Granulicella mallensis (strain ATCC BAA-1857 / DSM 23137 / MP5ACTX8) TaxID=682795 RepID=G8P0Z3_GRAMM|nr:glycosyltransferase [Granulicella mallensis]AEU35840.1 glycosyl transferase group 1 [Granulicella mallensis MP5ACTX8]